MENSIFIKALKCEPINEIPVWIMRQAGRYLPEYRKLRKQEPDFIKFCQNTELCREATLQPLKRFDLDAAILFSDILNIVDAFGFDLKYEKNIGPVINNQDLSEKKIKNLNDDEAINNLEYVFDNIKSIKKELKNKPLIGFAGSPWTVSCYLVEGYSTKKFNIVRSMLYKDPHILHALLKKIAHCTYLYLSKQIEAGSDVIKIFDSWGGILGKKQFIEFSLNYIKYIVNKIREKNKEIPIILFVKNSGLYIDEISKLNINAISLDWTADIQVVKNVVLNKNIALQGNLDPAVLYGSEECIKSNINECILQFKGVKGYIFNLGHGMYPDIKPDQLQYLIQQIKNTVRN
jgi:uroporphyrinogen decarboxylase